MKQGRNLTGTLTGWLVVTKKPTFWQQMHSHFLHFASGIRFPLVSLRKENKKKIIKCSHSQTQFLHQLQACLCDCLCPLWVTGQENRGMLKPQWWNSGTVLMTPSHYEYMEERGCELSLHFPSTLQMSLFATSLSIYMLRQIVQQPLITAVKSLHRTLNHHTLFFSMWRQQNKLQTQQWS